MPIELANNFFFINYQCTVLLYFFIASEFII